MTTNTLDALLTIWGWIWWIVLPLISLAFFWNAWMLYIKYHFASSIKWKFLEVKVPRTIMKTPKAMEQIFASAHAPYSYGYRFIEKYWWGKIEYWYSFEMVSVGGQSHFYVRTPQQYVNVLESAIYAQYPEAEIVEAEDYLEQMPNILPNEAYDVFGWELILRKGNCYPVRTYPMFEDPVEERRIDPVATLFEMMSKLRSDEQIWMQFIIRPAGDEIEKEGRKEIDKIMGKKEASTSWLPSTILGLTPGEIFRSPYEAPGTEIAKKEKESLPFGPLLFLTSGQREIIEGIERKISKLSFETTIRFVYIDKKDSFSKDHALAFMGAFRQFNTENLNAFKPDSKRSTQVFKGFFKKLRLAWRKDAIYTNYRKLRSNPHKPILNIEELATIYHFPTMWVAAPQLGRIESKKSGPPAGLPIVE